MRATALSLGAGLALALGAFLAPQAADALPAAYWGERVATGSAAEPVWHRRRGPGISFSYYRTYRTYPRFYSPYAYAAPYPFVAYPAYSYYPRYYYPRYYGPSVSFGFSF